MKMPDMEMEEVKNKIETSLVETYNFMGITVRFEKRLNIVEIDTRGMLTQDVQAQQSIDFNINTKFTSSTETKFIVIPMRRGKCRYSATSNYARWRAEVAKLC